MPIATRQDLQEHLHWAIGIELLTIPPYLYAMYSIKDDQSEAFQLIRSVVAEEMLHVGLTGNLLVSVGGSPSFYGRSLIATYPGRLPHHRPELIVNLERCSPDLITNVFMAIEQPSEVGSAPTGDEYGSLGEFYLEIENAVERLAAADGDLFEDPGTERQLGDPSFYAPVRYDAADSGGLLSIHDLESARRAIEIIIHQGEGLHGHHWADPDHQELTHYYKFQALADGTVSIGETWPLVKNPGTLELDGSTELLADLFDAAFSYVLVTLDDLFRPGDQETKQKLIGRLYSLMSNVLGPVARVMVARPMDRGTDVHVGPRFEFYDFRDRNSALEETLALAESAARSHTELSEVISELQRW